MADVINKITENRFSPRDTKTIIIHDGRFHADDTMFAAMASLAAERYGTKLNIVRTGKLPEDYSPDIVVGDIGMGIYDHHSVPGGDCALGAHKNTPDYIAASCGLLYADIKNILFPGMTETKAVFEAFIDIIEHCDNTPDNNTFSDSVGFLSPLDDEHLPEAFNKAFNYCKSVVSGFMNCHEKEKSGKTWATPKVCSRIVPGANEKKDERYWQAKSNIKNKYKYISFNGKSDIYLKSMDTYSLACGAMTQSKRQYWRSEIEESDKNQLVEVKKREAIDWPNAVTKMKNRTIFLEKYVPYGQFVKDISAVFIILPSQRGGYTVNLLKTATGSFRHTPDALFKAEGCSFIANDKRFAFFENKELALAAAEAEGKIIDQYLEQRGFDGYRTVFGGRGNACELDFYQTLISEDISLNLYAKDNIKNLENLTVSELHMLQIAAKESPALIHSFCSHLCAVGERLVWNPNVFVLDTLGGQKKNELTNWLSDGRHWDFGLSSYLCMPEGQMMLSRVYPDKIQTQEAPALDIWG